MVREPSQTIKAPSDILSHFNFMEHYDREHIVRVDLNNANEMIGYESISVGTDCATLVGPKEVFRGGLLSGASSIILVHNHPSGQIEPSQEDIQVAQRLRVAGDILGLEILDFTIIGRSGGYYSFSEHNML
jgi:DNA repair protein RadC